MLVKKVKQSINNLGKVKQKGTTRFIILFQGRSGSTYLIESLNNHPNIHVLLLEKFSVHKSSYSEQQDWAYHFYNQKIDKGVQAIGFKSKLIDVLDYKKFAEILFELNVKVIHLSRKNTVKLAISTINAAKLRKNVNASNIYREKDKLKPSEISIEEFDKVFKERKERYEALALYVDSLKCEKLNIYYEDILYSQQKTFQRIQEFLNVPFVMTKGETIKITPDNLRNIVTNFDELRDKHPEYREMFDE